jgi:hypothetical protein
VITPKTRSVFTVTLRPLPGVDPGAHYDAV